MEFTNYVVLNIEYGAQEDVVYTDIRKAFDRVRHSYLERKLNEFEVFYLMGLNHVCMIATNLSVVPVGRPELQCNF